MRIRVSLFLSALSTLALAHYFALAYFIYWKYDWFDIPMHFLGGCTVAFGYGVLPWLDVRFRKEWNTLGHFMIAIVCIGISWEIFEILGGMSDIYDPDFVFDTCTDLILDVLGGFIGYSMIQRITHIEL